MTKHVALIALLLVAGCSDGTELTPLDAGTESDSALVTRDEGLTSDGGTEGDDAMRSDGGAMEVDAGDGSDASVTSASVRGVNECAEASRLAASSRVGPRVFDGVTTTFEMDEWCGVRSRVGYQVWTAPHDGDFTFDTQGSGFDTVLGIMFDECWGDDGTCNDDVDDDNLWSSVTLSLAAGTRLTLFVMGYEEAASGVYYVNVTAESLGSGVDAGVADASVADASVDAASPGSDGGDGTCRRAFLTSVTYDGDLGGTSGGDRACQTAAEAVSLGGTWQAWLSSEATDAVDRVTSVGPWCNLEGDRMFNNRANLATLPLTTRISDEFGAYIASSTFWTGTTVGGESAGNVCSDWRDGLAGSYGTYGSLGGVADRTAWTNAGVSLCWNRHRLLCLEQ